MEIRSAAFNPGGPIPRRYSCEAEDVSPPLSWSGLPAGTKALALIMEDPDAPPGTWVHWVLYDLPADLKGLAEGCLKTELLPDGAKHGLCGGVDRFDSIGYQGPDPPPGRPHRYFFKLYALKEKLGLAPRATKAQVLKAMRGRILGQAELVGTYRR